MKIDFIAPPYLIGDAGKNLLQLGYDWFFSVNGRDFWIPQKYEYDGASIPRLAWPIIGSPFEPDLMAPALAHDWLYLTHLTDRKTADDVIYQLMRKNGVGTMKAHIIWAAVRSCAGFAWNNTQKDYEELAFLTSETMKRPDGKLFGLWE